MGWTESERERRVDGLGKRERESDREGMESAEWKCLKTKKKETWLEEMSSIKL